MIQPRKTEPHPFDAVVRDANGDLRLAEAALYIGLDHAKRVDVGRWLDRLDQLAVRVAAHEPGDNVERIDALRSVLVDEEGLTGSPDDLFDPRRLLLHEVLQHRQGAPVALSVVWLDVCERLGWAFDGVSLPGLYIIRVSDDTDVMLVSPLDGSIIHTWDCEAQVSALHGVQVVLTHEDFEPSSKQLTLTHMLANLKFVFTQRKQWGSVVRVVERLLALKPDSKDLHRELAAAKSRIARLN